MLRRYARLITVCPEVEIGLGVPRGKIVLVERDGALSLVQPATGRSLTGPMIEFSKKHVLGLKDVDGFLLKSKSPSCGVRDTKRLDPSGESARIVGRGPGLYAAQVLESYPKLVVEDERRLEHHVRREHWLTRLYLSSAFRSLKKRPSAGRLQTFHRRNLQLLKAYNRTQTARLQRLAAHLPDEPIEPLSAHYEDALQQVMKKPARAKAMIEAMSGAYKHYAPHLARAEKTKYRKLAEQCVSGEKPVNDLRKLIQVWAVRYDKDFTREHSLYRPYPGPLAADG
jgi:uncharacterized protein YbbK (DUF523 family)/uncharacterized protein YbgA (DUF1722 family)